MGLGPITVNRVWNDAGNDGERDGDDARRTAEVMLELLLGRARFFRSQIP